jgi:hypothetical protein
MKKIVLGIITLNLVLLNLSAQNPYPQIPIDSVQFVNSSQLINGNNTLPEYISPAFKNSTYRDTVRFEGVVLTNPQIYGLSPSRKGAYIQRLGGGPWSGVLVMCDPTILPINGRPTLGQLINETGFYNNMIPGKRVLITGIIRDFQGETQINLIRNNSNYNNSVELLSQNDTTINYSEIAVNQLMSGSPSDSNWIIQKQTGERWEGVPVIIRNVTVNSVSRFPNNLRFNWSVIDAQGNQIEIRDFSGYYRRDGFSDSTSLNITDTNRFTPPSVGTKISYIKGMVTEYTVNGMQRYALSPIYPSDVEIKSVSIASNQCMYRNLPYTLNIKQSGLISDTAYLDFATNQNFDTIVYIDTINSFNQNTFSISSTTNLISRNYSVRLRLKNNSLNSNTINIKTTGNYIKTLQDTIIAFKQDSVLLSAPQGYITYKWSNSDSTSNTWLRYSRLIKLTTKDSIGCSKTDSAMVIFFGGIMQKDTTICKESSIKLSIRTNYPTNGIVGYWALNGNANDQSGNGNNGNQINVQLATNRFGEANKASFFNGISSRILTNSINSNNWSGLTITYWCKQNTLTSGQVFDFRSSNQNDVASYHQGGNTTANNYNAQINNSTFINSNTNLDTGSWDNITITQNYSTNKFSIYVNGVLKNTAIATPFLLTSPYLNIGSRSSSAGISNYFKGYLDDIAIWKRALSEEEIKSVQFSNFKNNWLPSDTLALLNVTPKNNWSPNDTLAVLNLAPRNDTTVYCTFTIGSYKFTDSLRITVNPIPQRILPDTSIAFKIDSIRLNVLPGYASYLWNTNNTSNFIWVKNNGHFKSKITNQFGCHSIDSSRVIFMKGILQKDTTICSSKSIVLSSADSVNSYNWSNGQNTKSIVVSPTSSSRYYLDNRLGSFIIRDSIMLTILPLPNKNVNFNKLGLCENDTIKLSANPGFSYAWFKNQNIISYNRILIVTEPGKYLLKLADSLGCNNTSDTLNIFYATKPNLSFTINDTLQCAKQNSFLIEDQSSIDSGSYQRKWTFRNTPYINDGRQINLENISAGLHQITLITTTNYACKDSLTKNIVVKNNPNIGSMVGDSNGVKTSTPYVYAVAQQTNHSYLWSITNGIILSGQGTNIATLQWLNNGKGKIKVEITDVWGCSDTTTKEVNIGSVGIKVNEEFEKLNIYPNPNNGVFNIELNSDKKTILEISMINTLGQTLWTKLIEQNEGANKMSISPKVPSGVYKLILHSNNQETHKTIIIK